MRRLCRRGPPEFGDHTMTPACGRTRRCTSSFSTSNAAEVPTWRGRRRKLRCGGAANNRAWLKGRTAPLNLRNLLGRGFASRDSAWVLAT